MRGFLGWDVGAWHCQSGGSRDALVLLAERDGALSMVGRPWRGNLRATYNNAPGDWSELTLAIDTPLGWPESFHRLLAGEAPAEVPEAKARNPLLMRETERVMLSDIGGGRRISLVELQARIAKGPFVAKEAREAPRRARLRRVGAARTSRCSWRSTRERH